MIGLVQFARFDWQIPVLAQPALFEMLAPSQQGPVYVRLTGDAKLAKIGSEFNLNAAQVQAWIAILMAVHERMETLR